VEFVAPDLPTLLQAVDGYATVPKNLTIHTVGAAVHEVSMSWVQRFLHAVADPNIAYVLMTIGVLGIILEFATPGLGVSGVAGVIALLLAFYSFQILPVDLVGIALVVMAMILYLAEIKIQSHGILGIGGTVALIAGGLLLYDTSAPFLRVAWPVLVVATAVMLTFFALVVRGAAKATRRPHATGLESLVGVRGVATTDLNPDGWVRVRNERWKAKAEGGHLLKDEPIEVVRTQGLTLIVRRRKEDL
jgi:membrane-bound serine protease (ClpP class)